MGRDEIILMITVTCEIIGTQKPSDPALIIMANALEQYPPRALIRAFQGCQTSSSGRFTLHDIISRIEANDGRPGANEAWAVIPKNEYESCVWTEEIAYAYGDVSNLAGDEVAQRMAFIESYNKRVQQSREQNLPVKWNLSPGSDHGHRLSTLKRAVEDNKISLESACNQVPELSDHFQAVPRNRLPGNLEDVVEAMVKKTSL